MYDAPASPGTSVSFTILVKSLTKSELEHVLSTSGLVRPEG